jgi:hypothetical protein
MPARLQKLAPLLLGAAVVAVVLALATGCGTDLEIAPLVQGQGDTEDAGPASTPDHQGLDAGSAADAVTPTRAARACAQTNTDACYQCCKALHPAGERTYDDAYYSCMCRPSACDGACASTECNVEGFIEAKPGSECWNCETQAEEPGGACFPRLSAVCDPDVECTAFRACWDACFT